MWRYETHLFVCRLVILNCAARVCSIVSIVLVLYTKCSNSSTETTLDPSVKSFDYRNISPVLLSDYYYYYHHHPCYHFNAGYLKLYT